MNLEAILAGVIAWAIAVVKPWFLKDTVLVAKLKSFFRNPWVLVLLAGVIGAYLWRRFKAVKPA
jgi:hypothetical protein